MSDLHITSSEDYNVKTVENVAHGCKSIINTCNKFEVIVSGNIIDKGKTENYSIAEKFFNEFNRFSSR